MMVHWGLYSLLGGEYRRRKVVDYAEWAQSYFRIPNAEYEKLGLAFNPVYFDSDEWVRFARDNLLIGYSNSPHAQKTWKE